MNTKALVIAVVGLGCTVAAGTGAFLAQRLNIADAAEASQIEVAAPPATATVTEAIVLPEPPVSPSPVVRPVEPAPAPPSRQPRASRPAARADDRRAAPVVERDTALPDPPAAETAPPVRQETASAAEAPVVRVAERRTAERVELVVPADSVIGIRMESSLSSETAQLEDRVTAVVTRDVVVDGRTAIAAGSRLSGTVVAADRGGRFRERARLGVQFTSLRLPDNSNLLIRTEPVYRDGESPSKEAATKIGIGAAAGAVVGGIIGGKKGAVIGGATGAGAGTAVVTTGARNAAILESGASLTVKLLDPVTVIVDREQN